MRPLNFELGVDAVVVLLGTVDDDILVLHLQYKTLFYFDVPHAVDASILWGRQARFFIFTHESRFLQHGQGFGFRRHGLGSFFRHRNGFRFSRSFVRHR